MKTIEGSITFRDLEIEGYERVVEVKDEASGLHAIISLHDTRLGPALGGIRAYPYASFEDALEDALRLSKGMTYKAAATKSGTGGGKGVIITSGTGPKTEAQLLAFAEAVNQFKGHYICAEDVGVTVEDLAVINQRTSYAVGLPKSSGDPSRFTAFGGFCGVQAVCQTLWGTPEVAGRTVAIQGLGAVGMKLAHQLFWGGAKLIVSDLDPVRVKEAEKLLSASSVPVHEIHKIPCDIFSPCALGAILNPTTIPELKCRAVAGVANNQLLSESDGQALFERGILYAPDYVINSGGLLNVAVEIEESGYDPSIAREKVVHIYDLLLTIFALASERGKSTHQVANELAESNLLNGVGKRQNRPFFHY